MTGANPFVTLQVLTLGAKYNDNVGFMITNERQYRITRKRAVGFARAIEQFETNSHERTDVHPRLLRAELEGMTSQLADLGQELEKYEYLELAKKPSGWAIGGSSDTRLCPSAVRCADRKPTS